MARASLSRDVSLRLLRGRWHFARSDLIQAESIFREYISDFPQDFRGHFNLGIVLSRQKDRILEAKDSFLEAVTLCPELIEGFGALSNIYIRLQLFSQALEFCQKGLSVDPNDKICSYNFNTCMRLMGRLPEAVRISRERFEISVPIRLDIEYSNDSIETINSITVVCIKWGSKYDCRYVNNLFRATMMSFSPLAHSFVCFTDNSDGLDPNIKVFPFDLEISHLFGWWLKIQLFSPRITQALQGYLVYFDLDTIFTGICPVIPAPVDPYKLYILDSKPFRSEGFRPGYNSSIMIWKSGQFTFLFDFLIDKFEQLQSNIYKFDHFLEMMLYSDLETEGESYVLLLQDLFPSQIIDFATISNDNSRERQLGKIICFPLKPKPNELSNEYQWLSNYWQYGPDYCEIL